MKLLAIGSVALIVAICGNFSHELGDKHMCGEFTLLLQQFLDADTIQPYFHTTADSSKYEVIVAYDVVNKRCPLLEIGKFGMPVRFISKAEADSSNLEAFFWVIDFIYLDSSARMQLEDPIRKIILGAYWEKSDSVWNIESLYIEENTKPN